MDEESACKMLEMMDAIDPMEMFGEPINGKNYKAEGWQYRDIRWMTKEQFQELQKIIGLENLVTLMMSSRTDRDGEVIVGGQFIISPERLRRATEYATSPARE